jgi:hypothetical protein
LSLTKALDGIEAGASREAWTRAAQAHLGKIRAVQSVIGGAAWTSSSGLSMQPPDGELLRLSYPLFRGRTWRIRDEPVFVATVEDMGPVRVPAGDFFGVRVRIDSELFGPDDRVHFWYSRSGQLQLRAHLETRTTDPAGNPIVVASEQIERLESLRLH